MPLVQFDSMFEYYGADYAVFNVTGTTYELLEQRKEHWGSTAGIPVGTFTGPDPEVASNTILANLAKQWLANNPRQVTVGQRVMVGSMRGTAIDAFVDSTDDYEKPKKSFWVKFDSGVKYPYPHFRVRPE